MLPVGHFTSDTVFVSFNLTSGRREKENFKLQSTP